LVWLPEEVTVYPVILDPPVDGAVKEIDACGLAP
jgi:hypothetical protein